MEWYIYALLIENLIVIICFSWQQVANNSMRNTLLRLSDKQSNDHWSIIQDLNRDRMTTDKEINFLQKQIDKFNTVYN